MKLECRQAISPTPLDMRGIFSFLSPLFKSPGAGGVTCPPALAAKGAISTPLINGKDIQE